MQTVTIKRVTQEIAFSQGFGSRYAQIPRWLVGRVPYHLIRAAPAAGRLEITSRSTASLDGSSSIGCDRNRSPERRGGKTMGKRGPKTIDPTPQEIERWTKRIRAGWSERTHRLRAGWTVEAADRMHQWTAPVISVAELCPEVHDEDNPFWSN
jgi:hypothetical protein